MCLPTPRSKDTLSNTQGWAIRWWWGVTITPVPMATTQEILILRKVLNYNLNHQIIKWQQETIKPIFSTTANLTPTLCKTLVSYKY